MAALVILGMDMHCYGCAEKIRKAVSNMPGVEGVSLLFEKGQVVVVGTADAAALKARLETKLRKPVTIVADVVEEEEETEDDDDAGGMQSPPHCSLPVPPLACPPMGGGYHPYGYGWMQPPSPQYATPPPSHYVPQGGYYYPYGGNPSGMSHRQYIPNDAPTTFNDDNSNACCVQ